MALEAGDARESGSRVARRYLSSTSSSFVRYGPSAPTLAPRTPRDRACSDSLLPRPEREARQRGTAADLDHAARAALAGCVIPPPQELAASL